MEDFHAIQGSFCSFFDLMILNYNNGFCPANCLEH